MSLYHEVMEALTLLIEAFERLGITYYIGGSVSSSLHGMARRTQDVDVIADIRPGQVRSLVQALQSDYYVDEQAWQDAVRRDFPYNVLHLGTMLKVDLIPLNDEPSPEKRPVAPRLTSWKQEHDRCESPRQRTPS
jgi:hypothetical protein